MQHRLSTARAQNRECIDRDGSERGRPVRTSSTVRLHLNGFIVLQPSPTITTSISSCILPYVREDSPSSLTLPALIGAVLHTLNIRLFAEQVAYIINHAEDKVALPMRRFAHS